MMRTKRAGGRSLGVALALALAGAGWWPAVRAGSLEATAPVVIKSTPVAGTKDVDPGLTEITVVFSKPMQDGSWSWVQVDEKDFPEGAGKPRYLADKRTCVLPVKLEPGRFYALWLNTERFRNFKDAGGRPAVPYLLTFQTKGVRKP